ncbi:MAG: hypothetical protein ACKVTZ_06055, partial [Bacteroidia bacterium]
DKVTQMGFTIVLNGQEVQVSFTKTGDEVRRLMKSSSSEEAELSQIDGVLNFADGGKNKIKLVNKDIAHTVDVPEGLSDIVKLHWEDHVKLTVKKKGSKYILIDIEKAE